MDAHGAILKRLRQPRMAKNKDWAEFSHRKVKIPNPRYTVGIPFVQKWGIYYKDRQITVVDTLKDVEKWYGTKL